MHINIVIYVLLIDILAILSPGPDFFMVLKNAMTVSSRAGVYTALGIATGGTALFSLGMLGVGVVLLSSKWLFLLFKVVGALYLTYIALKSIFAKVSIQEPQLVYKDTTVVPIFDYFRMGLICNLTNPKAFMFIISLSTYAVAHGASNKLDTLFVVIGSGLATAIWFSFVSFIFGNFTVRKVFYQKQRIVNLIFGIILIYVALTIVIM